MLCGKSYAQKNSATPPPPNSYTPIHKDFPLSPHPTFNLPASPHSSERVTSVKTASPVWKWKCTFGGESTKHSNLQQSVPMYGAHASPKFVLATLRLSFLYKGGIEHVTSFSPHTNQTLWARLSHCEKVGLEVRLERGAWWTCTYRGSGWGGAVDGRGCQWFTSLEYVNGRGRPGASQTDIMRAAVVVCHGFWRGV